MSTFWGGDHYYFLLCTHWEDHWDPRDSCTPIFTQTILVKLRSLQNKARRCEFEKGTCREVTDVDSVGRKYKRMGSYTFQNTLGICVKFSIKFKKKILLKW